MRAIRQYEFGGPEVLRFEQVPDLTPAGDQVRIAVEAAGVHLLDTTIRNGEPGPFGVATLPMTPGREVAGTIDAVGPDADPATLGTRVTAHLGAASGGYAEQTLAPSGALIPIGPHVDAAEAVALVGTGRTAVAILEEAAITADDVVLVPAAAGGLGALLVEAAARAGATVVGAAGGPAKLELVRSLGAEIAVDYFDPDWTERVRGALGERRVTVALDGVGGAIGRAAFELVAPGGRMVLFGYTAGEPTEISSSDLFARGVAVTAAIGPRLMQRPGGIQAFAEEAVRRLASGEWHPVVTRFALADAAEAHRALVERRTTGKVVLIA
jgi:NADPH2:quinone reductase